MGKNNFYILKYFNWFYEFLNYKIFLIVFFAIIVGFFDGFGITMFLPLLQIFIESSSDTKNDLGKFQIIIDSLASLGIEVTITTILGFLLLFFLLKAIFKYYGELYRVVIQQYLLSQIRVLFVELIRNIKYEFFTSNNSGRIQNTMTEEINRLQQAFIFYFQTIEQMLLVIVYMCFTYLIDLQFDLLLY